jgi:hypothetical protein
MAIVGSVFAMLGRFAGRLLNSALGWAAIILFGKVEGRRQTVLLVMALGSLVWIVTIVGVLFPDVGTFVLAFVPVPDFVDEGLVRLAMLAAAILIPLLIGIGAVVITEAKRRPKGLGLLTGVLRGYPFTFVLAVTIAFLAVLSLLRKVRSMAKRWEDAHVPVIVKPGGYDQVLRDLEEVLDDAGLDVVQRPAPRVLSIPARLLDAVAGKALGAMVPDRLMLLSGGDLEVFVYPSDLAIAGSKERVARARAAIASALTKAPAYLTASAESEKLEDRIRAAVGEGAQAPPPEEARRRIRALDPEIARLSVPFEEWETVYRQRLQVERDLLARALEGRTLDPGPVATGDRRRASPGELAIGVGGLALLALDVVMQLALRRQQGSNSKGRNPRG